MGNKSFSEVESREFQNLLICLQPKVKKDLIKHDALKEKVLIYAEVMRIRLKEMLQVRVLCEHKG